MDRLPVRSGLVLSALASTALAGEPVPLLHYDFEDVTDPTANLGSLGAAHAGDLEGDAAFVAFGTGQAVTLDGDGDYVLVLGTEDSFDLGDGDFSVSVRLSTSNLQATDATRGVVWKEADDCGAQWSVGVSQLTGRVRFTLSDGTTCWVAEGATSVADGQPHDVSVTRTGGWARIDVDGKCVGLEELPLGLATTGNAGTLVIGGRALPQDPTADPDDFLGEIDDVAVYGVALFAPPPSWNITPYGCAGSPPGSLSHEGGSAIPGNVLTLGVNNPYGTQASGSIPVVGIAGAPTGFFPCGAPFPGNGMAGPGSFGELLISVFTPPIALIGTPWLAPGIPGLVSVPLPNNCNLVGKRVYVQGFLIDLTSAIGIGIATASAVMIDIGV